MMARGSRRHGARCCRMTASACHVEAQPGPGPLLRQGSRCSESMMAKARNINGSTWAPGDGCSAAGAREAGRLPGFNSSCSIIQREKETGSGRGTAQRREQGRRLTAVDARARPKDPRRPCGGRDIGQRARTGRLSRHCIAQLHPKSPAARQGWRDE